jgi:hypothetical protein
MKTVKQLLEHRTIIKSGFLTEKTKAGKKSEDTKIPTVIVLQRKAIRVFPDDQKIALYYSQALGKHVSIPFGPKNDALGIQISEENLDEAGPIIPLAGVAARAAAPYVARGLGAASRLARKKAGDLKKAWSKSRKRKMRQKEEKRKAKLAAAAAGRAAVGAKLKSAISKRLGDVASTKKPTDQEYQFGRELGRVGSPSQSQVTLDPSSAEQQKKAFGGMPTGYYRESSNLSKLKMIAENNAKLDEITFQDGKSVEVTGRVAKKILGIYESLNKDNRKNLEKMLNEDVVSFRKVVNFAIRQ